ncbi:type II toxin-antitoxin system RelE/ParE family toxin [Furfurilactobacillus entadae]|uniref:type II toxin-antitoxin system RelE/ParE family toxin n=1 Tax=Furfurilactobacillus entadae TaxID=2922307 RepID=UPI0038B3DF44
MERFIRYCCAFVIKLVRKVLSNIQRGLYFRVEGAQYLITQDFNKKTSKTPAAEIKHAVALRKDTQNENQWHFA